ncbi:MAG: hypothetical protein AAF763_06880 [Pseudomonadota bacterium]
MRNIAALAAAAALTFAAPHAAEAQDDTRGARMSLAESIYLDIFADEFARQTTEASMVMMRRRVAEAAFRDGLDVNEAGLETFADALERELEEDMDILAGDWASLMARNLTLEELQALQRAYSDPTMRAVLGKLPEIMQRFTPTVARLRDTAIRRTLVKHPPETLMR